MKSLQYAAIGAAIAAMTFGSGASAQQLTPSQIQRGQDASRINSPSQDFFDRGRDGLEREIRLLDEQGNFNTVGNDLLTIDESLKPENWLYPLEDDPKPRLEIDVEILDPPIQ